MDLFEVPALICSAELYEFPVAAVTSGHTLSGLKQHAFILLKFWGSESAMRQQGCVPSGGSGGESSPCLCQLLQAAYVPCLVAPHHSAPASVVTSPSVTLTLLPLS